MVFDALRLEIDPLKFKIEFSTDYFPQQRYVILMNLNL